MVKFTCGPFANHIRDFVDTNIWKIIEVREIKEFDFSHTQRRGEQLRTIQLEALIQLKERN